MAATETATAVVNISTKSLPLTIPSIKIAMLMIPITIPTVIEKRATFFCKGVFSSLVLLTISAILPISVSIPVATAITFALPSSTTVPI